MSATQGGSGGRPIGLPKTGGRKKGTPNRATLVLREKLAALGCDPAEELVKIAQDSKTPVGFRMHIYSSLMPYIYPKRTFVDDSVEERASGKAVEWALEMASEIFRMYGPGASERQEHSTPVIEGEPNPAVEERDDEN